MADVSSPDGKPLDMTAWIAPRFGNPTLSTFHAETEIDMSGSGFGGSWSFQVFGTGFTYQDFGDGTFNWTGGTIASFTSLAATDGTPEYEISSLSLTVEQFSAFFDQANASAYEAILLAGDDAIHGTAGADTLLGFAGNDTIEGNGNNDLMLGGAGDDTLKGMDGNDVLRGGTGNDTLDGDAGTDTVAFTDASGALHVDLSRSDAQAVGGGLGIDTLIGIENLWAGTYDDVLIDSSANNTIAGGSGNDTILVANGGQDTILGGDGDDVVHVNLTFAAGVSVDGGTGTDRLEFEGTSAALTVAKAMNVETVLFAKDSDYNIRLDSGTNATMVDAASLTAADNLQLDAANASLGITFLAGAGDDTIVGSAHAANVFDLTKGGEDSAKGGQGADTFLLGASLSNGDRIDGGGYSDVVDLNGDYAANHQLDIIGVETVMLHDGFDYNLSLSNSTEAAHITIDASALGSALSLRLDASGKQHGTLTVIGGAGDDFIQGERISNLFDLSRGGADTVIGGPHNNTYDFGAAYTDADTVIGGLGYDAVYLGSIDTRVDLTAAHVSGIEYLRLQGDHDYQLTVGDGVFASTEALYQIWAGYEDPTWSAHTHHFTFDGSALTQSGHIWCNGVCNVALGAGNDVVDAVSDVNNVVDGGGGDDVIDSRNGNNRLYGGKGNDRLLGNGHLFGQSGNDSLTTDWLGGILSGGGGDDVLTGYTATMKGGGGRDTFYFEYGGAITSNLYGTVVDFNPAEDTFQFWDFHRGPITAIDPAVTHGTLSDATFFDDVSSAIGPAQLGAMHAVLFTPDFGTLAGKTFLIVDEDGVAGLQALDYVIHLGGSSSIVGLSLDNIVMLP